MTKDKKRKQATRARMAKTGESYQAAHRATHAFEEILRRVIVLAEARLEAWQTIREAHRPKDDGIGPFRLVRAGNIRDSGLKAAFEAPEHRALLGYVSSLSASHVRKLLAFMYAGAYGDSILTLRDHLALTFQRHDLAVQQLLGRERVGQLLRDGIEEAARQRFDTSTPF